MRSERRGQRERQRLAGPGVLTQQLAPPRPLRRAPCAAPYPAHMKVVGNNGIWIYGAANSWIRRVRRVCPRVREVVLLAVCLCARARGVPRAGPQRRGRARLCGRARADGARACARASPRQAGRQPGWRQSALPRARPQVHVIDADTGAEAINSDFVTMQGLSFEVTK